MSTKIKTITESGNSIPVTNATTYLVKTDTGDDISVEGQVDSKAKLAMTCIVTRHFRDRDRTAWMRTLFCMAEGGNWSVKIGKLAPGTYTFVFAAEGEDIDCTKLEVAELKAKHKSIVYPATAIIRTDQTSMAINIKGSVNYYPQTVSCSLTPINSSGASTGPTSSKPVQAPSGIWIVGYSPLDVSQTVFSGLYSFTAWAYEGTASEPISV